MDIMCAIHNAVKPQPFSLEENVMWVELQVGNIFSKLCKKWVLKMI